MIGHVVISITEAPVIGWMATRWLWSGCEDGEGAHFSRTDIFLLCCSSAAEKLRNLQFALQRVSVFHPISLCNALFIAFLCNYSVIRLSSVQFFRVNIVFHCVLPLIGEVFSAPICVSTNKDFQKCYPSKARLGL